MQIDPAIFEENDRTAPQLGETSIAQIGSLTLRAGQSLPNVRIAYETWGVLNQEASNAVLVCHALSGDAHAIGWWSRLVGPGKAIDTDRFAVICSNVLGGCQGSTGPSSLDPEGKPYQSRFPKITIEDMVFAQVALLAQLGIGRLHAVCGGSMGGMQALEWARQFPGRVEKVWITASCPAHSAMQIGFNEVARQAIKRDPEWHGGDYAAGAGPRQGLAVARMLGHLSYLSEGAFEAKFGRSLQNPAVPLLSPESQFQVESYLNYQADKFTKRFDANSFLVLTQAIDDYDPPDLAGATADFLLTSFTSDWIYPSHQSELTKAMALAAGCNAEHHIIDLPYGHDAFLLDDAEQAALVRTFLNP